jgi:hypothetical protein
LGRISDSKTEEYDFQILLDAVRAAAPEHVIVVRVYDKYDNMGAAKTVLRTK